MPEPPLPEHMAFHARLLLCQESSPGTLEVHLLPRAPGAAIAPSPFSSVTQLLARDMDNDPLVFGVSGEEASRFFAVEPDTGVVWLRQPLDREV